MMPLGMANVGDVNIIKKITGRDDVRKHLAELGFVVGGEVRVISELGGNLILSRTAASRWTRPWRCASWCKSGRER